MKIEKLLLYGQKEMPIYQGTRLLCAAVREYLFSVQSHHQLCHSFDRIVHILVVDSHPPGLKLRYVYVDGIRAQWIRLQIHGISCA